MDSIVERLRNYDECNDSDIGEAADMLEFMLGQMRACPKMDGRHRWRFNSSWPITCAIGQTPGEAIRAAMTEVNRHAENEGA